MPFAFSLALALAATSCVSAANPTMKAPVRRDAISARMSGFGVSSIVRSCLVLIFVVATSLGRQSATAAALMTMLAPGACCSTASRISSAVCTGTTTAPAGGGSEVCPHTRVAQAATRSAALAEERDVGPDGGVVPHPAVHGRRDQHGTAGGEEDRGQEVVGDAVRRLGQEVGGGRRDHDGVRALGQGHVLHCVGALRIEEVREHGPAGERAEGEGADELARVLGQADGGAGAERGELAQEVYRLVGRDGPGDAEDQLFPIEGCHQALVSPSSFTRYSTFACEISSSATLVGFFCLDSTRAAAPRLIWRARLADNTTSR